jgi:hypothetical protein
MLILEDARERKAYECVRCILLKVRYRWQEEILEERLASQSSVQMAGTDLLKRAVINR